MTDDPIEQTWRPEVKALRAQNVGLLADLAGVATERDEAHAEIERLRAQHDNDMHTIDVGSRANAGLEIENERLRAELATAGNTLAAYVYSTHNPGAIPDHVKAAMRVFEALSRAARQSLDSQLG